VSRIFLCGLAAGLAWYAGSAALLLVFARDFLAAVEQGGPHARFSGLTFLLLDLGFGIGAIWVYSLVRERYGAGLRSAVIASVGWWAIKTLQSAKWVGLGYLAPDVLPVPFATSLIAAIGATMVGAMLYDRTMASRN
jgi:hypothetical protein